MCSLALSFLTPSPFDDIPDYLTRPTDPLRRTMIPMSIEEAYGLVPSTEQIDRISTLMSPFRSPR